MAKKSERSQSSTVVLTANRLRDGRVVWYQSPGRWVEEFADASIFTGAEEQDALAQAKEWERREIVVAVYVVAVVSGTAPMIPVTSRERIRAVGPSVRPDLAVSPSP